MPPAEDIDLQARSGATHLGVGLPAKSIVPPAGDLGVSVPLARSSPDPQLPDLDTAALARGSQALIGACLLVWGSAALAKAVGPNLPNWGTAALPKSGRPA